MKCVFAATLALILTPGGAAAQAGQRAKCSLTVTFGSYAMGIDRPTFERVEKLLARDRGVVRNDQRRWGREGEVTMCVTTKRDADAKRLFGRIKMLFPRKPRGPLTLESKDGRRFAVGATP